MFAIFDLSQSLDKGEHMMDTIALIVLMILMVFIVLVSISVLYPPKSDFIWTSTTGEHLNYKRNNDGYYNISHIP